MQGLSTSALPPSPQPLRVGRYEVLGRVAVGGMSEIFLAHEQLAGEPVRRVAIKLLRPVSERGRLRRAEAQFAREGRTLLRLDHPNVCHSHEFGKLADRFFIAMEWVDGISLRELIVALRERGEVLSLPHAVNLVAQVAAGLHHAHTARDAHGDPLSIVHRDVNPTNIMIRYDGVVKLIDFGVAQAAEAAHAPITEQIEGKLSYMAPEQIRGDTLDARADIFALGICLFEIVANARLYRRPRPEQVRTAVLLGDVPSVRAIHSAVPPELDAIVQLTLQKDPSARFQTARALQAALEEFLVDNNLPMGARPLAELMEPLFASRPSIPALEPSTELQRLVWEAEAAERDASAVSVLGPSRGWPASASSWQSMPEPVEASGARAVGARPSNHAELKAAGISTLSTRALAVTVALGAVAMVGVGFGFAQLGGGGAKPAAVALPRDPLATAAVVAPALASAPALALPSAPDPEPERTEPPLADSLPARHQEPPSGVAQEPTAAARRTPERRQRALPGVPGDARALLLEGVRHASRKDYRGAVDLFEEADALEPASPALTVHWASALYELAHFAEAYQRLAALHAEEQLPPELAQRSATLERSLEQRVTRLSFQLPRDADLHVLVDHMHLSRRELSVPRALTPGRHVVELRRGQTVVEQRVLQTEAGQHLRLGEDLAVR